MKKIFTLIAVAAMAISMNAQTTVFSAVATTALDAPAGAETEITSANATITGGKMYAINGQEAAKAMIKVQHEVAAFQCTNNNTIFKFVLNEALQAGDVISVRMESRDDTELGLWFVDSDSRPSSDAVPASKIVLAQADAQAWVDAPTYTVATGDGICGKTTFYAHRHTGKSTYFTNFTITRGGEAGINNVTVAEAENGAAYNLAGQKVADDFKGVVIKNGKKMIQK